MTKDEAKWAYWTKVINDWRGSGLTRNAYCKREGLKPTTFDYWRPLMARGQPLVPTDAEVNNVKQPVTGERVTLIPVKVIDEPRVDVVDVLTLKSPSGWEVRLPAQADPNWLIKVLRQLP